MKDTLITSSLLIGAVLVLRALLGRKLSRRLQYGLWLVVLVRLLLPVNLPAVSFSLLSASQNVEQAVSQQIQDTTLYLLPTNQAQTESGTDAAPSPAPGVVAVDRSGTSPEDSLTETEETGRPFLVSEDGTVTFYARSVPLSQLLTGVWVLGMAVMGLWFLLSNLLFWRRLCKERLPYSTSKSKRRVWLCHHLASPCLFGLFRPAIYLTPAAVSSEERLGHVLAHEEAHARHLDHIWSLLRCVCLTVYWFDPLVWVAAHLSRCDCELACDESAVRALGEDQSIPYGQTLLSLIPVRRLSCGLMQTATTMNGTKRQLANRLRRIVSHQGTAAGAFCVVAVALVAVSLLAFTGREEAPQDPDTDASAVSLSSETDAELSLDGAQPVGPEVMELTPVEPFFQQGEGSPVLVSALLHPGSLEEQLTVGFYQDGDSVSAAVLWSSPASSDLQPRRFLTLPGEWDASEFSQLRVEVLEDGFLGYENCVAFSYPGQMEDGTYCQVSEYYTVSRSEVSFLGRAYGETWAADFDGDGAQELYWSCASQGGLLFHRGAEIYSADLTELLYDAYPDWNYIEFTQSGGVPVAQGSVPFPDSSDGLSGALAQRYLLYDGTVIRCCKDDRATVDHALEGIDAPEEVLAAAKELVLRVYPGELTQEPTAWEPAYDDWRITYLDPVWTYEEYGLQAEVYLVGYQFHAVTPSSVGLAGGMYVDEDGWVGGLGRLGTPYLVFQVEGNGQRKLLDSSIPGDCSVGSPVFLAGLSKTVVTSGLLPLSNLSPQDLLMVFYADPSSFLAQIASLSASEQTELGRTLSWFRYNGTDSEIERFSHAVLTLRNTSRASLTEEQLLAYEALLKGLRTDYGTPGAVREAYDPTSGMTIAIPSEWTDLCCLYNSQDEYPLDAGQILFTLYEGTARSTGTGHVWTLLAYTQQAFYDTFGQNADFSQIQGAAIYVLGSDEDFIYCLSEPTDVQYLENNSTSRRQYETLVDGSQAVLEDFLRRNDITINQQCPASSCWTPPVG